MPTATGNRTTKSVGRRRRRRWPWVVGAVVALLGTAAGLVVGFQEWLVFMPYVPGHPDRTAPPADDIEQVWLTTAEGDRVEGWFIPGDGCTREHPGPAVIRLHGNGEIIDETYRHWPYKEYGISQLLPEYRSYGISGGSPTQDRVVGDVVWFYDWLAARPDVRADQIVLHGRSLGTGVAALVTKERPTDGLILESAFTSLTEVANRFWAPKFVIRQPFPTLEVLKDYQQPVLLLHGKRDRIVPLEHARQLNAAIPDSRLLVLKDYAHDDLEIGYGLAWPRVHAFLSETLGWEIRPLPAPATRGLRIGLPTTAPASGPTSGAVLDDGV